VPTVAADMSQQEQLLVAAAKGGDDQAFTALIQPYRREIHVHCYRLLGSFHDAEDAFQDTLLRAWRLLGSFEGRAPFRAWLYRIATNVCLSMLARAKVRALAAHDPPPVDLPHGEPGAMLHLTPYPDRLLDEITDAEPGPDVRLEQREAVELAFVAAVQLLPPRQRAVLALRDVLGFSAAEVAELLETTVASVTSALQRARTTLAREQRAAPAGRPHRPASAGAERDVVRRYVDAWHRADIDRLVSLLTEDAVLAMPPLPLRYVGREQIAGFFATVPAGGQLDRILLVETRANGRPAVAAYAEDPVDRVHRAFGIMLLAMDGEQITSIVGFADPTMFSAFGLPQSLEE